MSDGATSGRCPRTHPDAAHSGLPRDPHRVELHGQVEHDDVRFGRHDANITALADDRRKLSRMRVILSEAAEVVLQAVQRRGREHSRLPHPAAQALARFPRLINERRRARQRRAHRRAEALGIGDHRQVGGCRELRRARAGRGARIPEARAVEVNRESHQSCRVGEPGELRQRCHHSPRRRVRILDAAQRRLRTVAARVSLRRTQGLERHARGAPNEARLHAGQRRRTGLLPIHQVGVLVDEDLRAVPRQSEHGGLIRHRARRKEQRALRAEQFRRPLLEPAGGGVAVEQVVPDLGLGDRPPHRQRRLGYRVASQVDHRRAHAAASPSTTRRASCTCETSPPITKISAA